MSSATLVSALNLLQVLTLPTLEEVNNDISTVNRNHNKILNRFFGPRSSYEINDPPDIPMNVSSLFLIQHIENVDEETQTITLHGSLMLSWNDTRLLWDPRDYDNMSYVDVPNADIYLPDLWFQNLEKTKVFQYFNSQMMMSSNGTVRTISECSVQTECTLDYTNYPFDNATCSIILLGYGLNGDKLVFDDSPLVLKVEEMFGSSDWKASSGGNFKVTNMTSETWWVHSGGMTKTLEMRSRRMAAHVVRYEVLLKRNHGRYVAEIGLPIFASALCVFVSVVMDPSLTSLIFLIVCLLMQGINASRIISSISGSPVVMPRCVKMMTIVAIETLLLLAYRIVMLFLFRGDTKTNSTRKTSLMQHCENLLATVIAISGVVHFWILFF